MPKPKMPRVLVTPMITIKDCWPSEDYDCATGTVRFAFEQIAKAEIAKHIDVNCDVEVIHNKDIGVTVYFNPAHSVKQTTKQQILELFSKFRDEWREMAACKTYEVIAVFEVIAKDEDEAEELAIDALFQVVGDVTIERIQQKGKKGN